MTIAIPASNISWPAFRVLVRHSFGAGGVAADQSVSASDWIALPMQAKGQRRHGLEVVSYSRGALPFVGRAVLKLEYGRFADGLIGASATSTAQLSAGAAWNPTGDATDLQDLRGYEIRIQSARDPASPSWSTVWWGQCEYQEDMGAPGASIPMGTRLYHCVDGLQRAARWMMSLHGYINSFNGETVRYPAAVGAMGYNVPIDCDTRISKNFDSSQWQTDAGLQVNFHTGPGLGSSFWTARQAAEHALAVVKPAGEPLFAFHGYGGNAAILALLGGTFAWPVKETDTALEVLCRICKRERGRGVVFVDWADDSSAPLGPLTVRLTIAPQLSADVTFVSDPAVSSTATQTLPGAVTAGTTTTVDLIGDHRVVAGAFSLSDPYQNRFDYLETVGEPIEVACTLSYKDGARTTSSNYYISASLAPRWTSSELSTFRAATTAVRSQARHNTVYQAHGLPPNWVGLAGDGNGGNTNRIDYRCDDSGAIVVPDSTDRTTSPGLVKVLSDLPMFNGYDYAHAVPVRYDASTEVSAPTRRRWLGGVWTSSNRYLRFDETAVSVTEHLDSQGEIWLTASGDDSLGTRALSDTGLFGVNAAYNYQTIWLTVGLRLPHRVRFASGNKEGRKRGRAEFKDFHLWLGAPGCIWDLDTATGTADGWAPRRSPAQDPTFPDHTFPGLLRDDRPALAVIHALSWAWYGTDTDRRSVSWTIRDCGSLSGFDVGDVSSPAISTVAYPKLGQLVTTMLANGETHTVNTPITLLEYNNQSGATTWSTEWSELEVEGG